MRDFKFPIVVHLAFNVEKKLIALCHLNLDLSNHIESKCMLYRDKKLLFETEVLTELEKAYNEELLK